MITVWKGLLLELFSCNCYRDICVPCVNVRVVYVEAITGSVFPWSVQSQFKKVIWIIQYLNFKVVYFKLKNKWC